MRRCKDGHLVHAKRHTHVYYSACRPSCSEAGTVCDLILRDRLYICFANPPLRLCDDNATSSDFRLYRAATRKRRSCHLSRCGSPSSSCLAIVSRRAKGVTLGDHRWTHRTQPTSPSTTTKYRGPALSRLRMDGA